MPQMAPYDWLDLYLNFNIIFTTFMMSFHFEMNDECDDLFTFNFKNIKFNPKW